MGRDDQQKLIGAILLLLLLTFATVTSTAQSDGSCFPHETLYTIEPIEIRSSDSRFSPVRGNTEVYKTYKVYRSKKDTLFNSCWIKISNGWMLRRSSGSVIRAGAPGQSTTRSTSNTSSTSSSSTTTSKCYSASRAYITGSMNIRSGPSTSNSKVGSAQYGESFAVSQSQRGGDYCWLKISKGWIAKTARVQPTKPATKPVVSSVSVTYPDIEGSPGFISDIKQAFQYMGRRSTKWYNYARNVINKVESQSRAGARAHYYRVSVNPNFYPNTMELASVLVHEACHIYQYIQGRFHGRTRLDRETECVNIQIDFIKDVSPQSTRWINKVRSYLDLFK